MTAADVSRPGLDAGAQSFACAPTQAGMVFESITGPPGLYVLQVILDAHEALDSARLRQAWSQLVARHEALRLGFVIDGGAMFHQRVMPTVELPFVVNDWSALDAADRETRWRELLDVDREAGFELDAPPLLRVTFCRFGDAESRMLFTHHHAIADGFSDVQLLYELSVIYDALGAGAVPSLPDAPPFRRFAEWASDRAGDASAEAFWARELAGIQAPTPAPRSGETDDDDDDQAPGDAHLQLSADVSDRLREIAEQCGGSIASLLQAAVAVLLAQQSSQRDLLFSTTRAGRRATPFDVTHVVGVLMVASPVRVRVDVDGSLGELVGRLREWSLAVRPFEHTPLTDIRRASGMRSMRPFTDVLFNFRPHTTTTELRTLGPGWEARDVTHIERTGAAMTVNACGDREIELEVLWDGERCPAPAARHFLGRLEGLLGEIADVGPTARVGDLAMMPEADRARLSGELEPFAAPRREELVGAQFARAVAEHPDRVAVVHDSRSVSYRELASRAGDIAAQLLAMGVTPEQRVGVAMRRTPDLLSAVLAVHLVGGAYVPLDPRYPTQRLQYMLSDSGVRVVVTDPDSAGDLPADGGQQVVVDATLPACTAPPVVPATPADLSHVIYTSGSTGRPKGVMIEHGAVATLTRWAAGAFSDQERDGVLASTSLSFDLSVFEMLVTLALGGRIVLVDDLFALSSPDFDEPVTLVNSVPSVMAQLLQVRDLPASVRTVSLAGEALSRTLVEQLYAQPGVQRVWNLYGPSEDTTYSTVELCEAGQPGAPSIGRPMAGKQAYVLDERLRPVPVGVPGELLLGGAGLARGYLGQDELTAERFVGNPFAGAPSPRLYRTGDQVAWRPDGALAYHGRLDDQVKIRGFRIELGEVRHALLDEDDVQDAAVIVRGEGADRGLAAYVVAGDAAALDVEALRRRLAARLPAHLVPGFLVELPVLPLTPNGKVDRDALPELSRATSGESPRSPMEWKLAELWQRLLRLEGSPGPNDDFFELGGDSLLALSLLAAVEDELGIWLEPSALIHFSTLAGIAAQLSSTRPRPRDNPLIPLRPSGSRVPLVFVLTDHRAVIGMRNALPALMHDQPVYAVQAIDPANPSWRKSSIEAIARACLRTVREHQPNGPYRLGGYSLGGHVCWEVACLLQDLGEPVEMLVLLDTPAPEAFRWAGRLAARRRELRGASAARMARGYAGLVRESARRSLDLASGEDEQSRARPRGFDEPWDDAGAFGIMRRFHARTFSGPSVVYYTDENLLTCGQPTLGWRRHATGRLETEWVPGDHHSVLSAANIATFASLLSERLDRLDQS